MVGVAEIEEISSITGVPMCAGTINRGQDSIGVGLVANDTNAFAGMDTTAMEMSVIEAIFKLGDQRNENDFFTEERNNFFDNLN